MKDKPITVWAILIVLILSVAVVSVSLLERSRTASEVEALTDSLAAYTDTVAVVEPEDTVQQPDSAS